MFTFLVGAGCFVLGGVVFGYLGYHIGYDDGDMDCYLGK